MMHYKQTSGTRPSVMWVHPVLKLQY